MLLEIERECLKVYQKKVDDASRAKTQLLQSLAAKEAEVAALLASLGEHMLHLKVHYVAFDICAYMYIF